MEKGDAMYHMDRHVQLEPACVGVLHSTVQQKSMGNSVMEDSCSSYYCWSLYFATSGHCNVLILPLNALTQTKSKAEQVSHYTDL